jgi:hypothetical protein
MGVGAGKLREVLYVRVDRGRLNWGVFFVVLGAVPLAYARHAISAATLGDAWRLWPLVIVGIGLAFVLSRTRAFFIGGTLVALIMGLVFGSALAVGPNVGCGGGGNNSRSVTQSGAFDGGSTVQLNLQCGSAEVTTTDSAQWTVTASNSAGNVPQVTSSGGSLQVTSAHSNGWSFDRGTDDWKIQLPKNSGIDLNSSLDMGDAHFSLASANLASAHFTLNLGSLHVDLTNAKVGTLSVETNLGAAFVTLEGSSDLNGDLKTNLGSLEVCVPAGLGVQLTTSTSLGSSDFAGMGMALSGGVWQSRDYATAAHKAVLHVDTSLGSMKLRPSGDCK